MNFQRLSIEQLRPAPYNPRLAIRPGDAVWKKLERSLAEFDLVQPVVWNSRSGHVVSGHQRLEILKHRGETVVDCVVVDLPLEKEKALNVTLNNSAVGSDWDPDMLVDLLAELQALPEFDATLTGFDVQQLADLVLAPLLPTEDLTAPNPAEPAAHLVVTLEIPRDEWLQAETGLNEFLRQNPHARMHVGR